MPGCYPVEAAVSAAGDTPATTETEFAARTRAGNESVPRYSELREKKRIFVRELFNSLAQGRANSVSGAGAGAQQDRIA